MAESERNPRVDSILAEVGQWREELGKLREMLLDTELVEEVKWGQPCYTVGGKNVIVIHGFKVYCALLFFNGALMKDPEGILIQQTENVQAGRQIRFSSLDDIVRMEPVLKDYIRDAIAVEKSGAKVTYKKTSEFDMPEEFRVRLNDSPELNAAFEALTPGRQRAYLLHFSSAKQSKTREARIDKHVDRILDGKGIDD